MWVCKEMKKKTVISYVILYMVWSFLELFVVPRFASRMSPAVLSVLKEGFIKTLLWLLPAILLARRYEESLSIKTRSLMHRRIGDLAILAIVLVFTAFLSAAAYYQKGQLSVSESFSVSDLFVAISIDFRRRCSFEAGC